MRYREIIAPSNDREVIDLVELIRKSLLDTIKNFESILETQGYSGIVAIRKTLIDIRGLSWYFESVSKDTSEIRLAIRKMNAIIRKITEMIDESS